MVSKLGIMCLIPVLIGKDGGQNGHIVKMHKNFFLYSYIYVSKQKRK